MHLRQKCEHAEKCTEKACAAGCEFRRMDEWLSAPLTAADQRAEQRLLERRAALLRGEIPA